MLNGAEERSDANRVNGRERHFSGTSNNSVNGRPRSNYGSKEYGPRGFESNRFHNSRHDYDRYRTPNNGNTIDSESYSSGQDTRRQWTGSNASLSSSSNRGSSNRGSPVKKRTQRENEREVTFVRKSSGIEVGSKLEERKGAEEEVVTYVAAGTAPVSCFRPSSSPVSTVSLSALSNAPVLPANPSVLPISLGRNFADDGSERRNRPGVHSDTTKKSFSNSQESQPFRQFDSASKRDQKHLASNASSSYFVHQKDHESNALEALSSLLAIQNEMMKNQGHPMPTGPPYPLADIHKALERITALSREEACSGPSNHARSHPGVFARSAQRGMHPEDRSTAGLRKLPDATPFSEDMMPVLMRILQTQSAGGLPISLPEQKEEMSSSSPYHPAVLQKLHNVLQQHQQSHAHASVTPPVSAMASHPTTPRKQNYSSVVASTLGSGTCATAGGPAASSSKENSPGPAINGQQNMEDIRNTTLLMPPSYSECVNDQKPLPKFQSNSNHEKGQNRGKGESSGYQTAQSGSSSPMSPNEKHVPGFSIANGQTSVVNGGIAQSVGLLSSVQAQRKPSAPPPTENSAPFEVSKMDVLSEEIWHYYNTVTQTDKMLNKKLHLRDMLYYSISPVFPMCGLYVVGSSLNGFGNNSSDMDLCLMITNKDLDQKTDAVVVLNMIFSALSNLEWVANQKLILAKVPILRIKFSAPFDDITVDLNANNSVAIRNTHLLCYYSSFDWRVRPLVSIVKEWAKRKGINDANRSSFTSYSLVLMVLHYLQCGVKSPVLPSLQQLYPKKFYNKVDVRTLNVTHALPSADDWSSNDTTTLGELLIGFLDYYANTFDYDQDAISVRLGRRVERAAMARQKPNNAAHTHHHSHWRAQWRCICIEEPFTHSNTAHSIYDEMVFNAIKGAFQEAHQVLDTTRDLQTLLNTEPIQVNPSVGAGAVVYHGSYDGSRHVTVPMTPTSANSTLITARTQNSSKASPSSSVALVPSGSANSLNTANSDSSACSSNGDEENDRFVNVKSTLEAVTQNLEKPPRSRQSRRRTNGTRNQQPSSPSAGPV